MRRAGRSLYRAGKCDQATPLKGAQGNRKGDPMTRTSLLICTLAIGGALAIGGCKNDENTTNPNPSGGTPSGTTGGGTSPTSEPATAPTSEPTSGPASQPAAGASAEPAGSTSGIGASAGAGAEAKPSDTTGSGSDANK